ncbi:MAG: TerB family tellurite resistance protein [Prevotella sp.]|nr:TerB family tellurite resistance protein [Prevotella sp.]MBQ9652387.1 TerB family tellurite resistance protein [Prevotella sp.]
MAAGKWIGGALGFIIAGPLGALAGYALGSLFDRGVSLESLDGNSGPQYQQQGQRNSFFFSLLVLASYIIRADGKVMHSEMEYVRQMLRHNFGENAVSEGNEILLRLFEREKQMGAYAYRQQVMESCAQMAANMTYEQRLQLLSFLVEIAKSDGETHRLEIEALKLITAGLRLSESELDSLLNLRDSSVSLDAAYKVLEISPDATDEEVKKAYRRLALKHHPDRVATLGEDVRRAAEKKLQEINQARDLIYKARGMA